MRGRQNTFKLLFNENAQTYFITHSNSLKNYCVFLFLKHFTFATNITIHTILFARTNELFPAYFLCIIWIFYCFYITMTWHNIVFIYILQPWHFAILITYLLFWQFALFNILLSRPCAILSICFLKICDFLCPILTLLCFLITCSFNILLSWRCAILIIYLLF